MSEANQAPRATIVVSNYNGMKILPSCLNSIETQSRNDFETIVVDDCSTDDSVEMIRSDFPWVRLVQNRKNLGPSRSKNVGLREASYDLVAFLDNDTILTHGWLESMVGFIQANPRAGAVAAKIMFADNRQVINSAGSAMNVAAYGWDRGIFEMEADYNAQSDRVFYACSAAMFARKSCIEEVGGFDPLYKYPFEDVDLGWRLNLAGYEVWFNPEAVAYHCLGATMGRTTPPTIYHYERNRIRSILKNFDDSTLRNIRTELFRLYLATMSTSLRLKGIPRRERLATAWRMLQAVGWNLRKRRSTLEARRLVQSTRKVSDLELVSSGLLSNSMDRPMRTFNALLPDYQPQTRESLNPAKMDRLNMYDGCAAYLGPGWYNREFTLDYKAFRWTKEEAVCYLVPSRHPRTLVIKTVSADPLKGAHGRIRVNGEVCSEFYVMNGPQTIEALLPVSDEEGVYEVRIIVDNPFRPSETFHNEDQRRLGLGISKVYLTS